MDGGKGQDEYGEIVFYCCTKPCHIQFDCPARRGDFANIIAGADTAESKEKKTIASPSVIPFETDVGTFNARS